MDERDSPEADNDHGALRPPRTRRALPAAVRRVLLALGGLALAAGSAAGFVYTADAFDERVPVVVAARDLAAGEVLEPSDFAADEALLGDIPHIAWTADAPASLAGFVVADHVPAGALVGPHLLVTAASEPIGDELEVVVPIDTSLAPSGLFEGDRVLLIDPGRNPSAGQPGRPRKVLRNLVLHRFDGSSVRLYVPPVEWVWWRALAQTLGATPMMLPVPLGGDAGELAAELDRLWLAEHQAAAATLHPFGRDWLAEAAPGELEVLVHLDLSLAPSGVRKGDLVLLVDPGAVAGGGSAGRPRSVLRALTLEHFEDGVLGLWVPPEDWVWWKSLPVRLGAAPMVLRVADGSDLADLAERLNEEWREQWQQGS
ncbi:SAF domain-containing protein [Candidatus Poriferisodalis sp.]|uniref:SAF domain-containing protein n=1 Tax=Candidatus Poriferisodalis sp. TaxID=3101277 RepID=UPI003AF86BBA